MIYASRQRELAKNRGDDLVCMLDEKPCFPKLGNVEVRCWYGPYHVWVTTEARLGDAESKEAGIYGVRFSWPNEKFIYVPAANAIPMQDFIDQELKAGRELPREIQQRFSWLIPSQSSKEKEQAKS